MLKIKDLIVKTENTKILKGVDLSISSGDMAVLMGKNGSGKSTLSQVIMGSPFYNVVSGDILFLGKSILSLPVSQRANLGIFLSFQYPSEIEGVTVSSYLRMIYNKKTGERLSPVKFRKIVKEYLSVLKMDERFLGRYLNDGFSGGEKKRMEMLQMLVLSPSFVILDEVDSGLDVDALRVVGNAIKYLADKGSTFLIITHYYRILDYISPNKVFIMEDGKIVKSGDEKLAMEIEKNGYEESK